MPSCPFPPTHHPTSTLLQERGTIKVLNNGAGIPVEVHKTERVYVPELIFGHLLTSSNYNDKEKKVTGGRNGYGAKLANIFSKHFVVETLDSRRGRRYKQVGRVGRAGRCGGQRQEVWELVEAAGLLVALWLVKSCCWCAVQPSCQVARCSWSLLGQGVCYTHSCRCTPPRAGS